MVESDTSADDGAVARKELAAALARVAGGDRPALQFIYRQTAAKLFGVCVRILQDRNEAEDVLQEIYVTVWRRASAFDPDRGSPITWLAAIARNRAIDRLRAAAPARRTQPLEEAAEIRDQSPGALAAVIADEDHRRLMTCIDRLDPPKASAIRAAFLDGATYEELARRVNIPLGTMKSWIRRSLMQLRECLGNE